MIFYVIANLHNFFIRLKNLEENQEYSRRSYKDFGRRWREPGNKTLQRGRICGLVLFMIRETDQEGKPAGQRQSGAGAGKKFLVLFRLNEQEKELVKNR